MSKYLNFFLNFIFRRHNVESYRNSTVYKFEIKERDLFLKRSAFCNICRIWYLILSAINTLLHHLCLHGVEKDIEIPMLINPKQKSHYL